MYRYAGTGKKAERIGYMKKYKENVRRLCAVLLALMMCVTFMPAGVFAEGEPDAQGGEEIVLDQPQETVDEEPVQGTGTVDPEQPEEDPQAEPAEDQKTETPEAPMADPPETPDEDPSECKHESLTKFPKVKATCSAEGTKLYYECNSCGKKFFDQAATKEVASDSDLVIPIDPDAHDWDDGVVTRKPTSKQDGEMTYTCKLCGATKTKRLLDPSKLGKSFKLNDINVQFKQEVVKKPAASNLKPGRVWISGQKKSMKVSWENAEHMNPVEGVIILKAVGTNKESKKTYKEIKRLSFVKKGSSGEPVKSPKTTYTDTTAKTKDTAYSYRLVSYYVVDGYTYISPISDWAAGKTTTSRLKNAYSGTMSDTSVKMQSKGKVKLKVTVSSPKTKYLPYSRRWSSSNKTVATVSKGTVTAKAPGTATIRCRLASGRVITSKVTVVGAMTPKAPTLKLDYSTKEKIVLIWNGVKYATSYKVYRSKDGLHWESTPRTTTKTTITDTDVVAGHRYTYYVIAVNRNKGVDKDGNAKTYTAESKNSNVLNQKAVVKLRPTKVTGFPSKKTLSAGSTLKISVKVAFPESRKAYLQMKSGKKWTTKKTISLPKGKDTAKVTITFPNSWWDGKTYWRLDIPKNQNAAAFTTDTLTITATRRYQNPSYMVQIKNSISKHGYRHYVSPVLINSASTRNDHVNAMLRTARKYMGNRYVQSRSGAPGGGIDESGLVMQACYGAGVDLWPISPSTRPYNCVPNIMNSKLQRIAIPATPPEGSSDYYGVYAGDLIFFAATSKGTPIHVAIYTGLGGLIHADPVMGVVNTSTIRKLVDPNGKYKYHIVGVRRVFHF